MTHLLTKKDVCEALQVSERTLDRLRAKGLVKGFKLGGVVRFHPETVETAIAKWARKNPKGC